MREELRGGFCWCYERIRRLNRLLIWVACAGIVVINFLILWEVFTRYVLRDPATWTLPLSSALRLYVIYLSTAYTLEHGGHVGMGFVVEMLPAGWRAACERLQHVLGLSFVLLFLWESWRIAERAIVEGERDISTLNLPLSAITVILPVGLALMALTYVGMIVEAFVRPGRPAPSGPLDSFE